MTTILLPVTNSHFDGGFYNYDDKGELTVANAWLPWWQQGESPGVLHRPEFKPERIRFEHGQKLFTTFSTHRAGIYQRLQIVSGLTAFDLRVDCQYWSYHTDGSGGGLAMRIGLDPTGGHDPYSGAISWGEWRGQDDRPYWDGATTKTLTATLDQPQGEWLTIWLESRCRFAAKHNDAYFDNVQLWADIDEPEPPPPSSDLLEILCSIDDNLARIADKLEECL